jgi:hypothetical protein
MSRPSTLPRWTETVGGTPGAAITEPPAGMKDVGWQNGDTASAEFMNWIHWVSYKWLQHLSEEKTISVHAHDGRAQSGTFTEGAEGYVTKTNADAGVWTVEIPVQSGWTITGLTVDLYGDGAVDPALYLYVRAANQTLTALVDGFVTTNLAAAWTAVVATMDISDHVMAPGETLYARITGSPTTEMRIGGVHLKYLP